MTGPNEALVEWVVFLGATSLLTIGTIFLSIIVYKLYKDGL